MKEVKKVCRNCGIEYIKNKKQSLSQWSKNKYCSIKCAGEAKKIRDGLNRQERFRRKKGSLKQNTPEWLERIKNTTKKAMYRPDVQEKIRKKRKPLKFDHKIKISNGLAGIFPKNMINNGSYGNVQNGYYENSHGEIYFRSKWEANYALYLDFLVQTKQIKNWEYEPDRFLFESILLGTRSYTPDFKIFNNDESIEYHEVKGYMDGRSKTKLRRMSKYFPEIKLILIDKDSYTDIKKQLGNRLGFY